MTQDQGTKLDGMFTSGLQHWSSIDEKMESVIDKMNTAEGASCPVSTGEHRHERVAPWQNRGRDS